MTCVAFVHMSGGSMNLKAKIIMSAYGSKVFLMSVFHMPWCRPLGFDAVLSLMNEKPSFSFSMVSSLSDSIGFVGSE